MQRTISAMVGKGSVNHNSRKFKAANVYAERSHLNIEYCNENIRDVYHKLFDTAQEEYNARQTRADRRIKDYYEKICSGKQEKPFHELIMQIGDMKTMSATGEYAELARDILDEYFQGFQERNPNLYVFSSHVHMDEATPHIHIDFVPFITGSKRGLETRVSLKQALAAQGFHGGTRGNTEWNQWVQSEKEALAEIAARHGVEWEHLGTHEQHLSVLDFKKKERAAEVKALEDRLEADYVEAGELEARLSQLRETEGKVQDLQKALNTNPDYQLPEPTPLMSAKSYMTKLVQPLIDRLKQMLLKTIVKYMELKGDYDMLSNRYSRAMQEKSQYGSRIDALVTENNQLKKENREYRLLRKVFGDEQIDQVLTRAKQMQEQQHGSRAVKYNPER